MNNKVANFIKLTCFIAMSIGSYSQAADLIVTDSKNILTVSNQHYTAKINKVQNCRLFSLKGKDEKELLGFNGVIAAGVSQNKAYRMTSSNSIDKPLVKKTTKSLSVISKFTMMQAKISQTIVFNADLESIKITYKVIEFKSKKKSDLLYLPSINAVKNLNTIQYVAGGKLTRKLHGGKNPKDNITLNVPINWFALTTAQNKGFITSWGTFPPAKGKWWPPVFAIRWTMASSPMLRFVLAGNASSKIGAENTIYLSPRNNLTELKKQAEDILSDINIKGIKDEDLVHWKASRHIFSLPASNKIATFWAPGSEKIRPQDKLKQLARSEKKIELYSAKNESEQFQIFLQSNSALGNISAKLDSNGQQDIPEKWIKVYRQCYSKVDQPNDKQISFSQYPDSWPDALIDLNEQTALTTLKKSKKLALCVKVSVPENAKAGIYRSVLNLSTANSALQIPFSLRVWEFTLPTIPSYTAYMGVSKPKAKVFRGKLTVEDAVKDYIDTFIKERMSINIGELVVLTSKNMLKYADNNNAKALTIHLWQGQWGAFRDINGKKFNTPAYWEWLNNYLTNYRSYYKKNKIKADIFSLPYDEPSGDDFGKLKKNYQQIHAVWPELKVILTEKYSPELKNEVDVWCTPSYEITHKDVTKIHNIPGKEAWFYTCNSEKYPYPTMRIDRPGAVHRALGWLMWRYKLTGYLFWNTNEWSNTATDRTLRYRIAGPHGGDGYLVYPDLLGGKLNPSLRLFMLRDGLEDAEYLIILNKLAKKGNKNAKRLIKEVRNSFRSTKDYPYDSKDIYKLRIQIGQLINKNKED